MRTSRRDFLKAVGTISATLAFGGNAIAETKRKPNVVIIYTDDLGYGDVSCYGATEISTSNIDKIAKEGLRFTNAHTSSATCTPSRYSMLTGEYAWRKKGTGILRGDANMIIEAGRTTWATIMQNAGYKTAAIGKWHLGLGDSEIDWNEEVKPGPLEIGFDYSFLIPATGDRVPCVYLENHNVVGLDKSDPISVSFEKPFAGLPTGKNNPEQLTTMRHSHGHDNAIINGIGRIGYMKGGKNALWDDRTIAKVISQKACDFMEQNKANPFFIYFNTHDIHVPRLPGHEFLGKSGLGLRGDAILQLDWTTGVILDKLEELGLKDDTILIFSSDNGPVLDDGYQDQAVEKLGKHKPSGELRGGKYSTFLAGTRVPFIVRWPGNITPGVSKALISQTDMLASFASFTGQTPPKTAPDSLNILPALLGKSQTARKYLISDGLGGKAIVSEKWKYIPKSNKRKMNTNTNIETGADRVDQLYDIQNDTGEKKNIAANHPELVALLDKKLTEIIEGQKPE